MPLTFLPVVLSSLSDALVALGRISQFLTSEDLPEPYLIDKNLNVAVQVDGDFVWETVLGTGDGKKGKFSNGDKRKKPLKGEASLPVTTADLEKENLKDDRKKDQETPFELKNLKMSVPKGAFVGIVGRVGSGKVWILEYSITWIGLDSIPISELCAASTNWRNAPDKGECKYFAVFMLCYSLPVF